MSSDTEATLKLIVVVLVFTAGVYFGGNASDIKHEKRAAVAAAQQGAKDYGKLREAMDAKESVDADLASARTELDRVRRRLARREAAATKGADGAGASGCEKLLSEAVEFLGECRERYLGCAAKHDALSKAVQ
nr:MAG TPA: Protein of unknown function (DUF2514) [Caudoviricetes sp.]